MPCRYLRVCMENRKPGANPGRYRHCMRGGHVCDESRSLGDPLRRLAHDPGSVSQETCSADLTAVAPGLGADGSAFVKSDGVALCCFVLFVCRRSPFAAWNTAKRTIFAGSSDTAFHPRRKLPAGGKKHFGKKSLVKAAEKYRAAPRNSARSLRQDFCPNSKFGKRRNPVCI